MILESRNSSKKMEKETLFIREANQSLFPRLRRKNWRHQRDPGLRRRGSGTKCTVHLTKKIVTKKVWRILLLELFLNQNCLFSMDLTFTLLKIYTNENRSFDRKSNRWICWLKSKKLKRNRLNMLKNDSNDNSFSIRWPWRNFSLTIKTSWNCHQTQLG